MLLSRFRGAVTSTVITPSREEFRSLAREHTVVPVWTHVLADLETPVAAFIKLVGEIGRAHV